MKEEAPGMEAESGRPGASSPPPGPLPDMGLLQHLPAAHLGLLGQHSGLLPPAALQAALMASLAQQASHMQYQQALLGPAAAAGRLPPHLAPPPPHTTPGQLLGFQQREALLAWSKLAAQSSAARFLGGSPGLPHPAKLDDSGIQTSPKAEPAVTSSTFQQPGGGMLGHYSLPQELAGGTSPSPNNGSPPGNNGTSKTEKKTNGKEGGGREKVFVCQVCNRSFGYKHVLQNHERTHTGEKPFECKECHKRFTRDHHLKTHMRLHTGEKPYHCAHCDRQFVQVANLRRHLRVHTGERPYACEMCDSKFSDSNQLKAHMLIHKGEKPFKCENCFGTFRRRHHLMHHKCSKEPEPAPMLPMLPLGLLSADRSPPTPGRLTSDRTPPPLAGDELDVEADSETRSEASSGERLRSGGSGDDRPMDEHRRRERKQKETRRLVRPPPLTSTVTSPFALGVSVTSSVTGGGGGGGGAPEQTEPEDLSVRRPAASDEDMPDELPRRHADSLPLSADSSRDAFSETAGTLART